MADKKPDTRPINKTDEEILDWLTGCSKIDTSGYDGGWAFEKLLQTDEPIGVVDVRLAVRGFEHDNGLRKAVCKAMASEIDMAIGQR